MESNAPDVIRNLVARFEEQRESYLHSSYRETQLRREFIDPMWKALGWDMDNERGFAEQYKEVIHEDAIKLSSSDYSKAPDYCFRIGGVRKFFLEAKKPSVNVAGDPGPAFQLRSYAWSEKLPLSVLTDFEEFSVYDTRIKPFAKDKASAARIIAFRYTDYVEKWDEIAGIFSKDAVLKGSFDKYAETAKKKRGTTTVDEDFLAQIESWRDELARNIATRNKELTQAELNFAVQATIDRIVFLRICEDRGIEEYQTLFATSNGQNIYPRLVEIFRRADKKYNSGLFHFSEEKGRTAAPDSLTPSLDIDDAVLRDILRSLYYPESPYVFSALPADILGQVYEQFLGKVIRLTAGHQAKVEEKPEVKKAGGVYYTPTYIVDYIVKHTLGPLLEGKTPKQVAGGKDGPIRVLDPACGSGTFLLQAYQFLLDWYRDAYDKEGAVKNSKGKSPVLYQGAGGAWRLTTGERKRILTTHIFGVDIDYQAVEVTKLSLLLKVLEGESDQTLQRTLQLFHERALPDLEGNVKCGNSLIGPEFLTQSVFDGFDSDLIHRANVFDWRQFSPDGTAVRFDAVIGNPPYIRVQTLRELRPEETDFFVSHYATAAKGNFDIYVLFVERGLELLSERGRLGYIVPNKFALTQYGEHLRGLLSTGQHLEEVVDFGDQQVFSGATIYTNLVFATARKNSQVRVTLVKELLKWPSASDDSFRISSTEFSGAPWALSGMRATRTFKGAVPLKEICEGIFQGLITGADAVFLLTPEGSRYFSDATDSLHHLEPELLHPLVKGSVNLSRYSIHHVDRVMLFPYMVEGESAKLIPPSRMARDFPKTWKYLTAVKGRLEDRERGKWKGVSNWYAFGRSQNLAKMASDKILTPSIAKTASYAVDRKGHYFVGSGGGGGGGYGLTLKSSTGLSLEYVCGILNSDIIDGLLRTRSSRFQNGYYAYSKQFIESLPIRVPDPASAKDLATFRGIETFVKRLEDNSTHLNLAKSPQELQRLRSEASQLETQLNGLVAKLYQIESDPAVIT
jgi:type I restriction-modification system DNA methylase subunit